MQESRGDRLVILVEGVVTKPSGLANSCLGVLRGLVLLGDLLGLFSILLEFFFRVEFGIQVRTRVGPEI